MSTTSDTAPRRRLQPHKRAAIVRAARSVFGRAGYSRASIDAIAAEAAVSTRTIYKHFAGKEQLFAAVLEASATEVADAVDARVAAAVDPEGDVEAALVALGHALALQRTAFPDHFAMVRQINAEAGHFPPAVIEAWQEAGPRRVRRRVEQVLRALAERGALHLDDAELAARHFTVLVAPEAGRSYAGEPPPGEAERASVIAAGVRAFLYGYAPG